MWASALSDVALIVLAAGHSRRFGPENKLLHVYKGHPLAHYAAQAGRALKDLTRICVAREEAVAQLFFGYHIVSPDDGPSDMSASLRAGVAAATAQGASMCLFTLADMPKVTPALLAQVLERAQHHGAAACSAGDIRQPPAAFGAAHFESLAKLSGDKGAGALLRRLPAQALVDTNPALLSDVDTKDDLIT